MNNPDNLPPLPVTPAPDPKWVGVAVDHIESLIILYENILQDKQDLIKFLMKTLDKVKSDRDELQEQLSKIEGDI